MERRFAPIRVFDEALQGGEHGACDSGLLRFIGPRFRAVPMARNDAGALRECAFFDIQLSNSAITHVRLSPDMRHRPSFHSGSGFAGRPVPHFPRRGVRNDRAFHRARGARMCWHTGIPHAVGTRAVVQPDAEERRTEPGLGRRSSPAFRTRMDFAACCITDRELSLAPTPPGPRELSHGHALGPSARRVGVNLLSAHRIPDFRP